MNKKVVLILAAVIIIIAGWTMFSGSRNSDVNNALTPAEQDTGKMELIVYGSCEEDYLAAACRNFQELYGVKVSYQRLSTGEVYVKVKEEKGKPSADVWFGGTTDPYNEAKNAGLLLAYTPENAVHLRSDNIQRPRRLLARHL